VISADHLMLVTRTNLDDEFAAVVDTDTFLSGL
jgi:hypothetical protein